MGRPRKPVALHLIQRTFRAHRHAHLLPTAPEPAASEPEPEPMRSPSQQYWAFQALPDDVRTWAGLLECGTDFFCALPPDLTEAQAKRRSRSKWIEHGPTLVRFWGSKRTKESWAWRRWGGTRLDVAPWRP